MHPTVTYRWPAQMRVWRSRTLEDVWVVATSIVNRLGLWQHHVAIRTDGTLVTGREEKTQIDKFRAEYEPTRLIVYYRKRERHLINRFLPVDEKDLVAGRLPPDGTMADG